MEVSPKQLEFKGDFKTPTTTYLTLKNSGSEPLAFKIKTNAAKVYSVKPNLDVVAPNDSVKVSITLPSLRQSLPKNYKSKHKFLVMSLPADDVLGSSLQESWADLQNKYADAMTSTKIRVDYVTSRAGGSASRLNGRSKRISKFVPNGSAPGHEAGGTDSSSMAAGVAGGAAVGAGAAGMAAVASGSGSGSGSRAPVDDDDYDFDSKPARGQSYSQEPSMSYQSEPGRSAPTYSSTPAPMAKGSYSSREMDELYSQNERLAKRLESMEKLLILALMLLSFILGKLFV